MKACYLIVCVLALPALAARPSTRSDLSGYRTVETAIVAENAGDAPGSPVSMPCACHDPAGLRWPHKGSVTHKNKRWNFFIVNEGGAKMNQHQRLLS